ncbi:MAG: N-6 DNA methylase [Fastidiosipilaceae bacterium]
MSKEFIYRGYIEKVIQFRSNMFPTTSIPALLLLLSFDNSEIEFIDVSEMYTEVRRKTFYGR